MAPTALNASLNVSAAMTGGATKGGLGASGGSLLHAHHHPTSLASVTNNAAGMMHRNSHGHVHGHVHDHHHHHHHHGHGSGGVTAGGGSAHQGAGVSRGGGGQVTSAGANHHHHHGVAPAPARFFLAHHSIIVPKAAWGHAALRDSAARGGSGGVTSVSVSASCAAAAATVTTSHGNRHSSSHRRVLSVLAGSTSSSAPAPASSDDRNGGGVDGEDEENNKNNIIKSSIIGGGGGGGGGVGDAQPGGGNETRGGGTDEAVGTATATTAAADDDDADLCDALHPEYCPVSPEFNDARVPAWVSTIKPGWDNLTSQMASSATVPFLFLTMPQIAKNAALISAGRPEALAAIAWQGQVAGLLGNLLLLSYFADKGETSASIVQGVGVCATGALLFQICLAGHISAARFTAAAVVVAAGVFLSLLRMLGRVGGQDPCDDPCLNIPEEDNTDGGGEGAQGPGKNKQQIAVDRNGVPCVGNVQCEVSWDDVDESGGNNIKFQSLNGVWEAYQGLLGVIGLAALPQVGLASLLPVRITAGVGLIPGAVGAALGLVLVVLSRLGALPPALATAWGKLSGWTATLLFMTMPIAQLASNFAQPASLEGLSVLSSVLAMTGNALMVPRALYTRDVIWLTGSTWGCCLMGWGVMLSLFLGRRAIDGARYISPLAFIGLSAVFFGYLVAVLIFDGLAALAAGQAASWKLAAWRYQGINIERDEKTEDDDEKKKEA